MTLKKKKEINNVSVSFDLNQINSLLALISQGYLISISFWRTFNRQYDTILSLR